MENREVVQVGDEALIIDPSLKGNVEVPVYNADILGAVDDQAQWDRDHPNAYIPDPGAREWVAQTRPYDIIQTAEDGYGNWYGYDPPGLVKLCKDDTCQNAIPRGQKRGRPRQFCSRECSHRFFARESYRLGAANRTSTQGRNYAEVDRYGRVVRVGRRMPTTAAIATSRFRDHHEQGACVVAPQTGERLCPAVMYQDWYSTKKLCLVYAVLVDDWKALLAKERHEFYIRQWTTIDGRWIHEIVDDLEMVHVDKQTPPEYLTRTDYHSHIPLVYRKSDGRPIGERSVGYLTRGLQAPLPGMLDSLPRL